MTPALGTKVQTITPPSNSQTLSFSSLLYKRKVFNTCLRAKNSFLSLSHHASKFSSLYPSVFPSSVSPFRPLVHLFLSSRFPCPLRLDPLSLATIQRHTFLIPGSFSACSAPALRPKEACLPPLRQTSSPGVPHTHRLPCLASGPRRSLCSLWESGITWGGKGMTFRESPSLIWAAPSRASQSQNLWQNPASWVYVT